MLQQSSSSTISTSSDRNNHSLINVGVKDPLTRNILLRYYPNLDLKLDDLGYKGTYVTYELYHVSHAYDIDVNKQTNSGIAKFYIGDYQGAILIFDEILRVNVLHPGEIVQRPQLAAGLYNKGLCLESYATIPTVEHIRC